MDGRDIGEFVKERMIEWKEERKEGRIAEERKEALLAAESKDAYSQTRKEKHDSLKTK